MNSCLIIRKLKSHKKKIFDAQIENLELSYQKIDCEKMSLQEAKRVLVATLNCMEIIGGAGIKFGDLD